MPESADGRWGYKTIPRQCTKGGNGSETDDNDVIVDSSHMSISSDRVDNMGLVMERQMSIN